MKMIDMTNLLFLLVGLLGYPLSDAYSFPLEFQHSGCLLATPVPSYFPAEYEAGNYVLHLSTDQHHASIHIQVDASWLNNAKELNLQVSTPNDTVGFSRQFITPKRTCTHSPVLMQEVCRLKGSATIQGSILYSDGSSAHLSLDQIQLPQADQLHHPLFWKISIQAQ